MFFIAITLLIFGCFAPEGDISGVKYEYFCYIPVSILSLYLGIKDIFNKSLNKANLLILSLFFLINILQISILDFNSNLLFLAFSTFPLTYIYGFKVGNILNLQNKLKIKKILLFINILLFYFLVRANLNIGQTTKDIDTVSVAGQAFKRASVGSFESNSYAVMLVGVLIFLLILNLISKNIYKSNKFQDFSLIFISSIIFINLLLTFSRTSYLSLITTFIVLAISRAKLKFKLSTIKSYSIWLILITTISTFFYKFLSSKIYILNFILETIIYRAQSIFNFSSNERLFVWITRLRQALQSSESIIFGQGYFYSADNTVISLISTFGFILGIVIYVLYMYPFISFFIKIFSFSLSNKINKIETIFFILLPITIIIYSLTGDIIAQSKSLPIMFFTLGAANFYILNKEYETRI